MSNFARLYLSSTETLLGEPDNGIPGALGELGNTFENLAMDPAGPGPRRKVLGSLETLTSRVRSVAASWQQLESATQRLQSSLAEVNDLLIRVIELNATIPAQRGASGQLPNDLMDERDKHLVRLAELTAATHTADAEDRITVTIGTVTLLASGTPPALALRDGAVVVDTDLAQPLAGVGGEVGASVTYLFTELPALNAQLDAFAGSLAALLNGQQRAGYDQAGRTGADQPSPILDFDGGAGSLRVNDALLADPGLFAAAAGPGAPHDGGNAVRFSQLRTAVDGEGVNLAQRYNAMTVSLSSTVATAQRAADSAGLGVHGVSLDDVGASVRAQSLRESMRLLEQEARNASDGRSWLDIADDQLQSGITALQRVRDLAVRGATVMGPDEASAVALEVEALRDQLLSIANFTYRDRPIFGGKPAGDAVTVTDGAYAASPDPRKVERRIGEHEHVPINITAHQAFGFARGAGNDVFAALDRLVADLRAGDSLAVSAGIAKLDLARGDLTESLAAVGSWRNRINAALARSEGAPFAMRVDLAEVEDVDTAEAIMDLQVDEVAYQATLQAMARALPPSLASFLR